MRTFSIAWNRFSIAPGALNAADVQGKMPQKDKYAQCEQKSGWRP